MSYISIEPFDGWYESTIEDFCDNICPHFGLTVHPKDVSFSGFWSQGDGASFTGNFFLTDVSPSELRSACPTEVELHQLIDQLVELVEAHHEIQGKVSRMSSRYSHSNTMILGDYSSNNGYCNEETENFAPHEDTVLRIFRELADWLYSRLEAEYDFYLADATARDWSEAIDERKSLQEELVQLKADLAANPPQTLIQSNAITAAIVEFEVEIEDLTSKIDQLTSQFSYWPKDDGPYTIEKFYENYC